MFRNGFFRRNKLSDSALGAALLRRADAARDQRRFREAATLYEEALAVGPQRSDVFVQAGHMRKEAGDRQAAELHYQKAVKLLPDDADLALQLGHFFKVSARVHDAAREYGRALKLKPGWAVAEHELFHLSKSGVVVETDSSSDHVQPFGLDREPTAKLERALTYDRLVPELMPEEMDELFHSNGESIHFRRLGRRERTFWGEEITMRGVEAIRGFCIAEQPIAEVQVLLNGLLIHRGPTRSYLLHNERQNPLLRKHVFNIWLDMSGFQVGRHHLEIRFRDINDTLDPNGGRRSHKQYIVIAESLLEPLFEGGDAWTPPIDSEDSRGIDEQINARPTIVSDASRRIFREPIRNVLVLRTDQLGDIVISIPALKRLREIMPDAHIVGLFTSANADLARTLGLLDEIIVVDFPDDKEVQRKRFMTAENQERLRERLAPYQFDLALDLAPAIASRPLLLLSGAKMLAGMRDKVWPYITANFDFSVYDAMGRSDIIPASVKTAAFIEALGLMIQSPAEVMRRTDVERSRLEKFGIGPSDRFILLHTGARVIFSRWGYYNQLAKRILEQTDLKVIMLSEDKGTRAALPPGLASHDRFRLSDERLEFDDFDALLSYCQVFVGNDSGPKHLASLRGTNVVSLHTARINWGEWGQELTGKILHRQVPCAGCHVYNDPEECGRDIVCMTSITIDEVWDAMQPYLTASALAADAIR